VNDFIRFDSSICTFHMNVTVSNSVACFSFLFSEVGFAGQKWCNIQVNTRRIFANNIPDSCTLITVFWAGYVYVAVVVTVTYLASSSQPIP